MLFCTKEALHTWWMNVIIRALNRSFRRDPSCRTTQTHQLDPRHSHGHSLEYLDHSHVLNGHPLPTNQQPHFLALANHLFLKLAPLRLRQICTDLSFSLNGSYSINTFLSHWLQFSWSDSYWEMHHICQLSQTTTLLLNKSFTGITLTDIWLVFAMTPADHLLIAPITSNHLLEVLVSCSFPSTIRAQLTEPTSIYDFLQTS